MSATVAPAALTARLAAAQGKARVLREALPWINRWAGRTLVVKYGGSAMLDRSAGTGTFAADVALLHVVGVRVVVVHGAGPQISALARQRGLVPAFVGGRRVTDVAMLDVVRSALLDEVNPQLVAALLSAGAPAAGVGREVGELLTVTPVPGLGLVGTVDRVAPGVVTALLDAGRVPVVAGIGRDAEGSEHNINADEVAAAIAVALGADKVVYLTDVAGLYTDFTTPNAALLSRVGLSELRRLLTGGGLSDGMVPKVAGIVAALDGGVASAHLLDGRVDHALLLEIFTDDGVGTMVTP